MLSVFLYIKILNQYLNLEYTLLETYKISTLANMSKILCICRIHKYMKFLTNNFCYKTVVMSHKLYTASLICSQGFPSLPKPSGDFPSISVLLNHFSLVFLCMCLSVWLLQVAPILPDSEIWNSEGLETTHFWTAASAHALCLVPYIQL